MSPPRVRFAPSPTGDLHVGSVRAALFNWLHARARGGTFILRIEDTDRERSTDESTRSILEGMAWIGMAPDEGPYYQSERTPLYRQKIDELLASGGAYRCYCTKEHLAERRAILERQTGGYAYERTCRDRIGAPPPGAEFVVRARLPLDGEVVIDDIVKGKVVVRNDQFDDFILARTDGSPVYNLTVVVDDIDMRITHVIRGDDHLNNTPKQIHLYRLFGAPLPEFAHLPMVHGADGKKLSKRHGASNILQFRELGYLPETMLSFLARLGWSHGDQEEFTVEELTTLFDIHDVGASAAVFDHKKLDWQNARRIRELAPMELVERARPFFAAHDIPQDAPWLARAAVVVQLRAKTLDEVAQGFVLFANRGAVEYDEKARRKFLQPEQRAYLSALADALEPVEPFHAPELEQATVAFLETRELTMKQVGQPWRVALTGGTVSPGIYDCMEIFGRDVTLTRLRTAAALDE